MQDIPPSLQVVSAPLSTDRGPQQIHRAWQPAIADSLRERSLEAVALIAGRLRDPASVAAVAAQARKQTETHFHWSEASLSGGFGSVALLYLYLARSCPGQGWEELAQAYLRTTAQSTQSQPLLTPHFFGGSSGFAFLLTQFCQDEPRYERTRDRVIEATAKQVPHLVELGRSFTNGVSAGYYDVISGAAGTLNALLSFPSPAPSVREAIASLLDILLRLSGEDTQGRKCWFIPPEYFPLESYREQYPDGYFNLGLAHGIPGPLAALALAWQGGYRVEGLRDTIKQLSRWIVDHQVQDEWGINWPSAVPLQASYSSTAWSQLRPVRGAWCYGAPGIAASLALAAEALEDEWLLQVAIEALEAALQRPYLANLYASTICHGMSGLLLICLRFAHNTESQPVRDAIPLMVQHILDLCRPAFPLGVRNEEYQGEFIDDPGLLTGACGVGLALLAAASSVEPTWTRLLSIA